MRTELIEVVSIAGGKFHRPMDKVFIGNTLRQPRLMLCGRKLEPLNYFATIADADRHTGGRFKQYACVHCERKAADGGEVEVPA